MEPLRISIIGIDGSGKSSTTLRAIHSLSHQFPTCKTGRTPFSIRNENISYCLPRTGKFFEDLFKRVDATKKRQWIGMTRILFVLFQSWLEPYMIKRYHPVAVVTTRCMIIDSGIYSDFYYPWISRKLSVDGKLRLVRLYSRLPFRDLYFFLLTPIQMAMERIYGGSRKTILKSLTEGTTGFISMSTRNLSGHWIESLERLCK
jgi:thymidylate kinase